MLLHPARLAAGLAVLHRVHAKKAAVGSLLTKKGDLGKRFCRRAAGGSVLCRSCAVEIFCRSVFGVPSVSRTLMYQRQNTVLVGDGRSPHMG